ncbi:MAG: serine/threonine-protein kinase [Acidobacteriota bacterium]
MIGQILGNYKIEEKLGEGGMGAVYRGVDTMLDREVAIKALRPELASQTSVVERFRSEAVTLAKLNHPNIATLYSMFRQGEELYMVLEFVRGETLDSILLKRGALPAEEAIPVFCQVLDGIDHAHELGIVHRDIKPANMMLTEKGTLKVLDFGIARLLGSARMTRAGNIIGTLEYMAPEQVRGLETDGRTDLYALGMMLYEVLTGKLPFDTDNEFELMKSQTEMTPRPPREVNPAIPELVEAAIMRAIEKNPDDRFQTGGEFRTVLLEAGFADSATMHGATGTYRLATRTSRPAASVPEKAAPSNSEIKSTRLGEAAQAPAPAMKATRLGNMVPVAVSDEAAPSTSFFSDLTAIHYAGAGVLLLALIGGAIVAAFMIVSGKGPDTKAANTKVETKAETPSQRPDIVTMPPTQTQSPAASEAPAQSSTGSGSSPTLSADQPGDLTPVEPKAKDERPSAAPPKAAPVKKEAPAPRPKTESKPNRAEKLLTGN